MNRKENLSRRAVLLGHILEEDIKPQALAVARGSVVDFLDDNYSPEAQRLKTWQALSVSDKNIKAAALIIPGDNKPHPGWSLRF